MSCEKDIEDTQIFTDLILDPDEILADGESAIQISVAINEKASSDRRNFIFSTTAGVFAGSGKNKDTSKAEYVDGVLTAKAVLKAPFSAGQYSVTVKPEFDSPIREFQLSKMFTAKISTPATIKLEPSRFGITSNFGNEVFLDGFLKSKNGKNVSSGVSVIFQDKLPNGDPALGRFRDQKLVTTDSSKVSTYYSVPSYPIGTTIKITATVLDENGVKTNVEDIISITINQ